MEENTGANKAEDGSRYSFPGRGEAGLDTERGWRVEDEEEGGGARKEREGEPEREEESISSVCERRVVPSSSFNTMASSSTAAAVTTDTGSALDVKQLEYIQKFCFVCSSPCQNHHRVPSFFSYFVLVLVVIYYYYYYCIRVFQDVCGPTALMNLEQFTRLMTSWGVPSTYCRRVESVIYYSLQLLSITYFGH